MSKYNYKEGLYTKRIQEHPKYLIIENIIYWFTATALVIATAYFLWGVEVKDAD